MSGLLPTITWQRSRLTFPMNLGVDVAAQALGAASSLGRGGLLILETTAVANSISHHVIADNVQSGFVNQTLRSRRLLSNGVSGLALLG